MFVQKVKNFREANLDTVNEAVCVLYFMSFMTIQDVITSLSHLI